MISREDLHPDAGVPAYLQDYVTRIGGLNPHDEPMWRIVRAENRYCFRSGTFAIWPEGTPTDQRGGMPVRQYMELINQALDFEAEGKITAAQHKRKEAEELFKSGSGAAPPKVERGKREIRKYAGITGYVLEKWQPAHMFGSPDEWESVKCDGYPVLGPYPRNGDYEFVSESPNLPAPAMIQQAIQFYFRSLAEQAENPAQRVLERIDELEKEEKYRENEAFNEIDSFIRDDVMSLRNRLSLGAGRVMNELATKLGLPGHYGN